MTAPPPALSLQGICKSFGKVQVLHDVDLTLPLGQTLGLVGENGAGKSTLLNILGGNLPINAGTIALGGLDYAPTGPADAERAGVAFIHQELNLFENLSIAENFFLTRFPHRGPRVWGVIDRHETRERTREFLQRVGLAHDPDTVVGELSSGEKQLVEIAKALSVSARVILFDEPTTSLTRHEAARLFDLIAELQAQGQAMIYISHDLDDVLKICDEIAVLRDGHLVRQGARDEWDADLLVQAMVGRKIESLFPSRDLTARSEVVLEVEGLTAPGRFEGVNLSVQAGEIVGMFGLVGAGRSEVLRGIFGLDETTTGRVRVGEGLVAHRTPRRMMERGVALLTEDRKRDGLFAISSVSRNFGIANLGAYARNRLGWISRERQDRAVTRLRDAVQLDSSVRENQMIRTLSGGNQQKVIIGRWLVRNPQLLLLDEPTRGIDVGAKQKIYQLIGEQAAAGSGVLVVSSEIEELIGLCDRIVAMRSGRVVAEYPTRPFDREEILRAAIQG